jgi:hypothetical protein
MNDLGQMEIHPIGLLLGLIGAFFGVYMANSMGAGIGMKITVFAVVGIVCFFVSNLILNKD